MHSHSLSHRTLVASFSLISRRDCLILRWLTPPSPLFSGVRSSLFPNHHPPLQLFPRPRRRPPTVRQTTTHPRRAAPGAYISARRPVFNVPNVRPSQPDFSLSPTPPFSLEMNSPVISLPPPSRFSPLPDLVVPMQHESSAFVLSSNPPNPKANFRFGDWMYVPHIALRYYSSLTPATYSCPSASCAAHNFGCVPLATSCLLVG